MKAPPRLGNGVDGLRRPLGALRDRPLGIEGLDRLGTDASFNPPPAGDPRFPHRQHGGPFRRNRPVRAERRRWRWQVSWLAGRRLHPAFPVSQWLCGGHRLTAYSCGNSQGFARWQPRSAPCSLFIPPQREPSPRSLCFREAPCSIGPIRQRTATGIEPFNRSPLGAPPTPIGWQRGPDAARHGARRYSRDARETIAAPGAGSRG